MTGTEIIQNIVEMNYTYNENSCDSVSFWREAVLKVPEFVKEDIKELRKSVKETCSYMGMTDFTFNPVFGDILEPLKLDIIIEGE